MPEIYHYPLFHLTLFLYSIYLYLRLLCRPSSSFAVHLPFLSFTLFPSSSCFFYSLFPFLFLEFLVRVSFFLVPNLLSSSSFTSFIPSCSTSPSVLFLLTCFLFSFPLLKFSFDQRLPTDYGLWNMRAYVNFNTIDKCSYFSLFSSLFSPLQLLSTAVFTLAH